MPADHDLRSKRRGPALDAGAFAAWISGGGPNWTAYGPSWVVWLVDRRKLGGEVRALSARGPHATSRPGSVRSFRSKKDAKETWRRALARAPHLARYRAIILKEVHP